jgi:tRNA 2-thiouridine synthesizing protein A
VNAPPAETLVDARGMRCPWPVLRLARAMRELGDGETVIIVADDPIAPREIASVAGERGWVLAPIETAIGAGYRVGK